MVISYRLVLCIKFRFSSLCGYMNYYYNIINDYLAISSKLLTEKGIEGIFFRNRPWIFRFLTLPLEILNKTKLYPWKFQVLNTSCPLPLPILEQPITVSVSIYITFSLFVLRFLLPTNGFWNHCPMKPSLVCQPPVELRMFTFACFFHKQCFWLNFFLK